MKLSLKFQGKRVLYREALRNLLQISDPNEDPTYFQESVVEGLIDQVLDGKLVIMIDPKDQKILFQDMRIYKKEG